jgi:TRAP-type C4-dicarboxylate transport system permease small subunit
MSGLADISRRLSLAAMAAGIAGLVAMTAIIFAAVVARYALDAPLAWAEQAALLLMIWTVMLAAAAGVREGFHIEVTVVTAALPPRMAKGAALMADAIVFAFGGAMLVAGMALAQATAGHVIPTLGWSRAAAYVPLTLSGALILLFAGERIAARLMDREVPPAWPS